MKNILLSLLYAVLLAASASPGSARSTLLLNGEWRFAPTEPGASTPVIWHESPVRVPGLWTSVEEFGYPPAWRNVRHARMQRTFAIPPNSTQDRVYLCTGPACGSVTIYLNGHQIAPAERLPYRQQLDITEYVKVDAENTLEIAIHADNDWAGLLGDVSLELRPVVHIAGVRVDRGSRTGEVIITAIVRNQDSIQRMVELQGQIEKETTGDILSGPMQIPPGRERTIMMTTTWPGDHLWHPGRPAMHQLRLQVKTGRSVIDSMAALFALRESAMGDRTLLVNGIRTPLLSLNWPMPPLSQMARMRRPYIRTAVREIQRLHINALRLPWMVPSSLLDETDAAGCLVIRELAPDTATVEQQIAGESAHPSVICWALPAKDIDDRLSNSPTPELLERILSADRERAVLVNGPATLHDRRVVPDVAWTGITGGLSDELPVSISGLGRVEQVDPRFWMASGGDAVFQGLCDWFPALDRVRARELSRFITEWLQRGIFHMGLDAGIFRWFELEGEYTAENPEDPGVHPRRFIADDAMVFNAGFNALLPPVLPSPVPERLREINLPVGIRWHDETVVRFGGTSGELDFTINNRTHGRTSVALSVDTSIRRSYTLEPGESLQSGFIVHFPETQAPLKYPVHWSLESGGTKQEGVLEYQLYAKQAAMNAPVYHLSQEHGIPQHLRGMGIQSISVIPAGLPKNGLLVTADAALPAEIQPFVAAGGRLLLVQPTEIPAWIRGLIPGWDARSIACPSRRLSPLDSAMAQLPETVLGSWGGDGVVSEQAWSLPVRGNFRMLALTGDSSGVPLTPLLELRFGRGCILLSGLRWGSNPGRNPAATAVYRFLVDYMMRDLPDTRQVSMLGKFPDTATEFLGNLGVRGEHTPLEFPAALLADVAAGPVSSLESAIERVQAGATLLCLNVSPEQASSMTSLLGVSLVIRNYAGLHQQLEMVNRTGILNGIAAFDLLSSAGPPVVQWVIDADAGRTLLREPMTTAAFTGAMPAGVSLFRASARRAGTAVRTVSAPGAGLLQFDLVRGRVIISQVALSADNPQALRFYSTLLTNLGIPLNPAK